MATIGSLNIVLSASTAAFESGMKRAQKSLSDFASFATSAKGLITGALGAIGVGLSVNAIEGFVHGQMEAIDATAKLSDRLGISTEAISGFQHAASLAGVSNELLTGSIEKMLKSLGGLSEDGVEVGNVFERLGLSADALKAQSPDQTFLQIADAIKRLPDPYAQATAATQIFGKAGQSLLPLLLTGAEGIKAAQAEAEKLGLTFSRVDAAKVEAANDAITRMGAVFTGIGRTLAIGIAPYVDALASKFVEIASSGEGLGPPIVRGMQAVAGAIAAAADSLKLLEAGFYEFRATALQTLADVVKGFAFLVNTKATGLLGPAALLLPSAADLKAQAGALEQEAVKDSAKVQNALNAFGAGANSKGVAAFFKDIQDRATKAADAIANPAITGGGLLGALNTEAPAAVENLKKISDLLTRMQRDADTFGLPEGQKGLIDLKAAGASDEQIAQAQAAADRMKALQDLATPLPGSGNALTDFAAQMERLQQAFAAGTVSAEQFAAARDKATQGLNKSLADEARRITDSVKTPLEKYTEQVQNLQEMLDRGLIDQKVFDRAKGGAAGDFFGKDTGEGSPKFAAAIERRFTFATPGEQKTADDPVAVAKQSLKAQQDAVALGRKQSTALDKIAGKLTATGGATVTVVSLNN